MQCVLLVQKRKECQRCEKIKLIGSPFPAMQMRTFGLWNCWATLLSSNTVPYEYVYQLLSPWNVFFWCKNIKNVNNVKIGSPFSVMQMSKFGVLKLLGRPPIFEHISLWVFISTSASLQRVLLVQEREEFQACVKNKINCVAIFSPGSKWRHVVKKP